MSAEPFNREQWLEAPECRRCHLTLSKEFDEEWPDDDRALLCHGCASRVLEGALAALDLIVQGGYAPGADNAHPAIRIARDFIDPPEQRAARAASHYPKA